MSAADWDLPRLKATIRLTDQGSRRQQRGPVFGVQFYPFLEPGEDPFFAMTMDSDTVVCRLSRRDGKLVEVIRAFKDQDPEVSLNSCAWTKDRTTGHPLLCVAGARPKIAILDVVTGELLRTLVGHGSGVNDLAVSPTSVDIIASGSEDRTIRLWSLEERHRAQPCALICAGEGHRESILTIAFHESGRYLLSGGMDCVVNLWLLPDLANETTGGDDPVVIHYPHFTTSALHSDYVDCVMFFHDLILSKCAREPRIVLWRICGFNPSQQPGSALINVGAQPQPTLSAFGDGFERLLQFHTPAVEPFYMRFGLFQHPGQRAVLAMGNWHGKIFLWDLQSLVDGTLSPSFSSSSSSSPYTSIATSSAPLINPTTTNRKKRRRSSTTTTTTTNATINAGNPPSPPPHSLTTPHLPSHPFRDLPPHSTLGPVKKSFVTRQMAWSPAGDWLVAVGDQGWVAVLGR